MQAVADTSRGERRWGENLLFLDGSLFFGNASDRNFSVGWGDDGAGRVRAWR